MKTIAILLSTLLLVLPALSVERTDTPDGRIAQNIDLQIQRELDEAEKQASTKVNRIAKDITVRITSATNGGSGVLIAQKGNTYLVLTNAHVTRRTTQFEIQAPDGQKYTAKPIDGGFDRKYDLALLEFTSPKQYQLANLANPGIIKVNDRNIYSAGFPFDSKDLRISPGAITQLSDIPFDNGTQIGYEIAKGEKGVRQGMSGGPIFDTSGVFLGINTIGAAPILPNYTYNDGSKPLAKLAAKYREANWGVPVYNFLIQVKPDVLYGYKFSGLDVGKIQRQATLTGYMAKLNDTARKQTVRIENSGGNGSGVIIAREGNSYYVLTAKHVVENQKTQQPTTNNKIITYDQDNYTPTSIVLATGLDLAVVKFTSQSNYPTAQLGRYSPNDGDIVLAGGFPGRDKINSPLWQWQLNPGYLYDPERGKFQTQDKQSFTNGYDLIYTSISYGGMSGGAVFDREGKVIGIHGQAETTEKAETLLGNSQGISIKTFIGIADKLKVKPQLLKIASNKPAKLDTTNLQTIITAMQNLTAPQPEDDGERWLSYGNQLYRTLQYDKSVAAFDTAIAKGKKLTGNYGKALSLFESRKHMLAEIALARAIAAVPASKRANYYYFWRYQSVNFRLLEKYDDALTAINIAVELEPNDPILRSEKANVLSTLKQYLEAIAIWSDLIQTKPEAYTYNNRGTAKSALGNNQGAISDYDRAIAIDPQYVKAYYNRGVAKSALGNKQGAISDYDRAIAIDPQLANAYSNRGNAKSALGNKQEAISDYDRAIAIDPQDIKAYNNRGLAKSALGNKQGAISDYDRAIAIDPQFALAYNNRGNAKYDLGNNQGAISDYDRAIAIDPQYVKAYYNRGVAKSALGNNQGAISDYDRAIAIDPQYADAYYNRGNAKAALGNKQGAIGDYDRAIAIDSQDANAYYNRGVAKLELGNKQESIDDLSKAAELFRQQGQIDLYQQAMGLIAKLK
jgi:tetratricopeptide (TPR) repeat protein